MLLDLLPDIDRCFSLVLQPERQMLISTVTDNYVDHQSSIMQVQQTTSNSGNNYSSFASAHHGGRGRGHGSHYGGRSSNNRTCTNCGRRNHTIDTCFALHGYPPGNQHKNSKSINVDVTASNTPQRESHANPTPAIINTIQEQYNHILQLLQHSTLQASSTPSNPSPNQPSVNSIISNPTALSSSSSPTFGKISDHWVVDFGATDHITHSLHNFVSNHTISPVFMSLPNGQKTIATIYGTVQLSPSLILHDVYYIPTFHVNFISVTQLLDTTIYDVFFTINGCFILQISTQTMIGAAEKFGGLFVLKPLSILLEDYGSSFGLSCNSVSQALSDTAQTSSIWHTRLGHISDSIHKCISSQFPFVNFKGS